MTIMTININTELYVDFKDMCNLCGSWKVNWTYEQTNEGREKKKK